MSLIKNVKNPISLARTVMEKTKHNYLVGESAEKLAAEEMLERMDNSYFSTDKRKEQLLKAQESDAIVNDHDLEEKKVSENKIRIVSKIEKNKISNSTILEKLLNLSEMENTDFEKIYKRKNFLSTNSFFIESIFVVLLCKLQKNRPCCLLIIS